MSRSGWLVAPLLVLAGFAGCQTERSRGEGDGVHPADFADEAEPGFHGAKLRESGYPLGECRVCHGEDYAGGRVGSSCVSSGCHTEGVESCGTCHEAEPTSGAHVGHRGDVACTTCHVVPTDARGPAHPGGSVDVTFSGLASASGREPRWDPSRGTCAQVYCHGERQRAWTEEGPLGCGDCHDAPPASHAGFADASSDCAACHGGEELHLNGVLDVREPGCDGCHGAGPLGAPPPGLFGVTSGGAVGAHARHLDEGLADRIGRVVPCADCHVVPTSREDAGHVDDGPPADVSLAAGGVYAADGRSCVVGCHGGKDPGPAWDDDSGAARACDACHTMPPTALAGGGQHPPSAPTQAACEKCHTFDPQTHVDGKVDVDDLRCDSCHGEGPLGAPPPGLGGELSGGAVGAHRRHLDGALSDRIGRVARCTDCHVVPSTVDAPGHLDASPPADVRLWNQGAYSPAARTCVSSCHWSVAPGPAWDDDSGAARACDACHGMPPATTRIGTPHPPTAPELAACLGCHAFDPATHVDGVVNFAN